MAEKNTITMTTDELTGLLAQVAINMVKGDLRDMVASVVEDKVCEFMERAIVQLKEQIQSRQEEDEWLVGSTAIAAAIGVSRNKFYELRKKGYFGGLLDDKEEGQLMVRKSDLLKAYKEHNNKNNQQA